MPAHYNFREDFPIAQKVERLVSRYLRMKYGTKTLSFCKDNRYDLLIENADGKQSTIELKQDFTCRKTGNVGIEYSCRGKPSGIEVSKADFYLYVIHPPEGKRKLALIRTSRLKEMISKGLYFRKVDGGDFLSHSLNYLFKLPVFLSYAKLI